MHLCVCTHMSRYVLYIPQDDGETMRLLAYQVNENARKGSDCTQQNELRRPNVTCEAYTRALFLGDLCVFL